MSPPVSPTITEAPCERCRCETRHEILHEHKKTGEDEESGIWWSTTDETLRCAGCHTVSLRRTKLFSEDTEPTGEPIPDITCYPTPTPRHRPEWVDQLNEELAGLLEEIYEARRKPMVRLIAMGVRAVVDAVMNAELGDVGGFEEKLEALVDKGLISIKQRELLAVVVDAGSAAGHRGFAPQIALIDGMIDAIENLLHQHYIIEPMVEQQKRTIPPRPPRPPKQKGSVQAAVSALGAAIPPPPGTRR
jgi:hypothetical protein